MKKTRKTKQTERKRRKKWSKKEVQKNYLLSLSTHTETKGYPTQRLFLTRLLNESKWTNTPVKQLMATNNSSQWSYHTIYHSSCCYLTNKLLNHSQNQTGLVCVGEEGLWVSKGIFVNKHPTVHLFFSFFLKWFPHFCPHAPDSCYSFLMFMFISLSFFYILFVFCFFFLLDDKNWLQCLIKISVILLMLPLSEALVSSFQITIKPLGTGNDMKWKQ